MNKVKRIFQVAYITNYKLRITFHVSRFTFHVSRITFHASRHYSFPIKSQSSRTPNPVPPAPQYASSFLT
ncbi:hypothetical protein QUF80_23175 [Desulfococcaceae bacterium HSG8]|nr:hypothetical protein [Desulfococcaceae bacterium HSG8]